MGTAHFECFTEDCVVPGSESLAKHLMFHSHCPTQKAADEMHGCRNARGTERFALNCPKHVAHRRRTLPRLFLSLARRLT